MKILSWNVAGLRATLKRGSLDFLKEKEIDVLCIQETKAEESQVKLADWIHSAFPHRYWNSSKGTTQRKGFSGTCIWSKQKPVSRIDTPDFDEEGRTVTLEFEKFILVTVYTPNSQCPKSERLAYRTEYWQDNFEAYIQALEQVKPVVVCGDFNVAHEDIDVHRPDDVRNVSAGFLDIERLQFQQMLDLGYEDCFRKFNKEAKQYTYWDQRVPAFRKRNLGWRIDYFLASRTIAKFIRSCSILPDIMGSDHCPVEMEISFKPPKLSLDH